MVPALRQKVVVQPGGVIEVHSSELVPGTTAEVIIMPETGSVRTRSMASLIGAAKGGLATPGEADAFIRQERDA